MKKLNNNFKLSLATLLITSAMHANAGIVSIDGDHGKFSIDGDVEFDYNYQNHDSDTKDFQLDQGGRILFNINSERSVNGYTFKARVSPGYGVAGNTFVDDVWFAIASDEGGELKIGHFEAYDLFPAGQDTFLDQYGATGDGSVSDSAPYMYRAKEGRGRNNDGQVMYSRTMDNLYMEVAAKLGDVDLFAGNYHGQTITSENDVLIVRPVVAYQAGKLKLAAGFETNLANESATVDVAGKKVDIMDRKGYGVTGNYSDGSFYVNMSYSAMDAVDENNVAYGVSIGYSDFCVGYMGATNEITNDVITSGTFVGDVQVDSVYASYKFTSVLDVKDFDMYVGGYQSTAKEKDVTLGAGQYNVDGQDDMGLRLRFKYIF